MKSGLAALSLAGLLNLTRTSDATLLVRLLPDTLLPTDIDYPEPSN